MKFVSPRILRATASGLDRVGMLGAVSRAAAWATTEPAFQVLTYHRVNNEYDPFFPAVPISVFEAQMRHISQTYTVLHIEELAERMCQRRVPKNAIAVTFDDGYRDTFSHAAPIVAHYALRATVFLVTAYIGSDRRPWFDEVAMAFKTTSASSATMPWGATVNLATRAERLAALDAAWSHLKRTPEEEFKNRLEELREALSPLEPPAAGPGGNGMLQWHEVKALTHMGFTIGAHTVTHPILSRLTVDRAREEIAGSRDAIRAAIGCAPRAFAYPNGTTTDYTAETVRLVRDAGFTCAVTTRFGLNTKETSLWELARGGPWESHLPTFALKLAAYRLIGAPR